MPYDNLSIYINVIYDNLSIYINVIYDNYIFRNSRVCSRHFCAGVPNYIHPVPTITMGYTISIKPMCGRRPPKERPNIVNEQEIKIIEKEPHTDEHCYARPGGSHTNLGKVTIPVKTKNVIVNYTIVCIKSQ